MNHEAYKFVMSLIVNYNILLNYVKKIVKQCIGQLIKNVMAF
jgi:hypothetical protein